MIIRTGEEPSRAYAHGMKLRDDQDSPVFGRTTKDVQRDVAAALEECPLEECTHPFHYDD